MITYTWDIFRLDCAPSENGLTDVVKVIHWILQAQDENGVSSSINNSYTLPSPSPEEFSDYSTLTKETVIGWLESNLDVGYLKSRLANEIATQYNPPIVPLPLPWVKVEEPVLEVIEEPVSVEEPVLEVVEEPVAVEEPVLEVIEEPVAVEEPVLEVVEEPVAVEEPASIEPTLEEMVADGYNPDARDGDGDGLVQDTTKWERPIDTQL
jgi:hypothetical protein